MERGLIDVPDYCVSDVDAELKRFDVAVKLSINQVEKLRTKAATLSEAAAEELTYLLDAHRQMLAGSRLVRGVEERIRSERLNAEAAVQAELSQIAHAFAAMEDAYLAGKIQDVREVSGRLVRNLTKAGYQAFSGLAPGAIIIAEEITPADTALMDPAIGGTQRSWRARSDCRRCSVCQASFMPCGRAISLRWMAFAAQWLSIRARRRLPN
jgi:phosphotransferase system enzyme I (PtsI)